MNTTELNRFLKSESASEIKDLQLNLEFPISNFSNTFELGTLYRYVKDQVKLWESHDSLPQELLQSKNYFSTIRDRIEQLVEMVKSGHAPSPYISELTTAISTRYSRIIPADSAEASYLISIFKESSQLFNSAYAFFLGNINYSSFSDINYLQGVIMAALFKIGESPTINRTPHDRSSFNALKTRVEKYVSESDSDLKNLFQEGENRIQTYVDKMELIINENQTKLDKWFAINQTTAKNLTK